MRCPLARLVLLFAVYGFALDGCIGCAMPVVPVSPPGPTPVDPGPVDPPADPTFGSITIDQYIAAPEAGTVDALVAALGQPFRRSTTGGFDVLVYALKGSDSVAWFMSKDGNVVRKQRL